MLNLLLNYFRHDGGTTAVSFATLALPLLLSVGVAVDYSNLLRLRAKALHATDAAVLAAAISANESGLVVGDEKVDTRNLGKINLHLKKEFDDFFLANMQSEKRFDHIEHKILYDPASGETAVEVFYKYEPYFVGILGGEKLDVEIESAVQVKPEQIGAVSMFLVLDKSGSMRSRGKMDTLKLGVNNLSTQFEKSDPSHLYIRMGAIAYDTRPSRLETLQWGTLSANRFVQNLHAFGGTDSFKAVSKARGQLRKRKEINQHKNKNGQEPKKVLVFMTDGANNTTKSDKNTKTICDRAKLDEIEIYSVAFEAPEQGRKLLEYCASSAEHYFDARNPASLLAAFDKIGKSVSEQIAISR